MSIDFPKSCAIINGQKNGRHYDRTVKRLEELGIEVFITQNAGDATSFVQSRAWAETLIAVGGDGTLHEVLNGIKFKNQVLATIPLGTVNSIGRALNAVDPEPAFELLHHGVKKQVDVIRVEWTDGEGNVHRRWFAGFLALGHEGRITNLASKMGSLPGVVRYGLATFLTTFSMRSHATRLLVDEETLPSSQLTSIVVNNCASELFSSVRSWDLNDGMVEVQLARRNSFTQFLYTFNRFMNATSGGKWLSGVRHLNIELDRSCTMMIDGEVFTDVRTIDVKVHPKKLFLLVPKQHPLKWIAANYTKAGAKT